MLSFYFEYYPASREEYCFDEDDAKLRELFSHFLLQFPRLRSVEVPITMLLGTDPATAVDIRTVLASTVQQLCLQWDFPGVTGHNFWDDEGRLLGCVRQLLPDWPLFLSHLKQIVIRVWDLEEENYLQEEAYLKETCRQAGIDLTVVSDELYPGLWTQFLPGISRTAFPRNVP